GEGKRVLAVAARPVAAKPAYGAEDETELRLVGFLAFVDPPDPDAGRALAALREDGVVVKILSGDNALVCRHLAVEGGLHGAKVVMGADVARLDDAALGAVAERAAVFARVSPDQKHRIILALKRRGRVVGFLGDGINDAPSLHS